MGKEPACHAGVTGDAGSIPGSGRSSGGGHGNPLQCSCLENPRQRSLTGYSPWGHNESDTTEATELARQHGDPKREDMGSNTRYPGHCSKQATPRGSSPKEEVGVQEARAQSGPKEKRDGALHTRDPSRPQQDRVQAHLGCCDQHQTPGSRNRGLHLPVLKAVGLRLRWGTGLLPRPWCVDTSSLGSA